MLPHWQAGKIIEMMHKLFLFFLLFCCTSKKTFAQTTSTSEKKDSSYALVRNINIIGNKKTKDYIILRELDVVKGDSILNVEIEQRLLLCRNRLFNTRLFTQVSVSILQDTLFIEVKERFYTYPLLILSLADRNFNEWWELRNHDLRRINYGINFVQRNVRGRNETFKATLQGGFSHKLELSYTVPYLNKNRKTGLMGALSIISEKKVAYTTNQNILMFIEGNDELRRRFQTSITLFHRSKYYTTSYLSLLYTNNHISDTVAKLNPRYFLNFRKNQSYFSLRYNFINDRRDIAFYPLKGYLLSVELNRYGLLPTDALQQQNLFVNFSYFKKLSEKWYGAMGIYQKLSFPYNQPYYNFRALGYNLYTVSGYELYVVDGQHFSLAKLNLKYKLWNFAFKVNLIPIENLRNIPITVYLKLHSDAGYVRDNTYNPGNAGLSNRLLLGNGIGVDIVSYYDIVMRVEYSINNKLQQGIFLHMKAAL